MEPQTPRFYAGAVGAVLPFVVFLVGVSALGLSGAPDERGFWPVLLASLALGLGLARDRSAWFDAVVRGMSQPIVMTMVLCWIVAGVLGAVIGASDLVVVLTHIAADAGVHGGGFAVAAFFVCCVVSTATGTSLGTLLVCAPLLYPAGGALGAEPAVLIGAILGGATFGDNLSPVSDTTIASATTQEAPIGAVVRSRLAYALPAAALAVCAYLVLGSRELAAARNASGDVDLTPLWMLLAPAVSIALLLWGRRHLAEGLFGGVVTAVVVGLVAGLITPGELLFIDGENYIARGLVLDGMERAVGVSMFTLLLMGVLGPIESAGLLDRLLAWARARSRSRRAAEWTIFGTVSAAAILTTHSVVAILTTGKLARDVGDRFDIPATRRANILDVTVCTYPFLLPFCIPTILAASTTVGGASAGMPRVAPWDAGLCNFHAWALLFVLVLSLVIRRDRS